MAHVRTALRAVSAYLAAAVRRRWASDETDRHVARVDQARARDAAREAHAELIEERSRRELEALRGRTRVAITRLSDLLTDATIPDSPQEMHRLSTLHEEYQRLTAEAETAGTPRALREVYGEILAAQRDAARW